MIFPHLALATILHPFCNVHIAIPLVLSMLPDFFFFGIEYTVGQSFGSRYWITHSLAMNVITALVLLVVFYIFTSSNFVRSALLSGIFLSHWLIDAVCMPWTMMGPQKLPLGFSSQPHELVVGLELYKNNFTSSITETIALVVMVSVILMRRSKVEETEKEEEVPAEEKK
eukprot:gnl/Dysnectes_brevis/2067_a2389_2657.p1 GENE.gnl/Dysnectes_brevis/2067_a2389_2657~~gnl/Dysnectes_brevis/2067_a2389_2657.p1  ORF type:complete len:170 (-),score=15.19 gnl/Dysnectes_brevis/2067_a2389_2657:56-565(-)